MAMSFLSSTKALGQMSLPTDVDLTCEVSSKDFGNWFVGGTPALNGPVNPADSVNLSTSSSVCDFYKWGAQMFLWVTSPSGNGLVLDSPALFNVLPANANKVRYLQANSATTTPAFSVRSTKQDDIGEVGQAGSSGVLLSQQGSLVYYGVHVNDVYGYFLTGQKNNAFPQLTTFPRNQSDLTSVTNYVASTFPSVTLEAPETLVMEFKTSWVSAASVPDASQFITMTATVPEYTPNSTNTEWKATGTATLDLALTGIHIVGTVQNHPEFIWITYEHIMNAPDQDYYYQSTSSPNPVLHSFDSSGTFLFMATGGPSASANVECAYEKHGNIHAATQPNTNPPVPVCPNGISSSNTVRNYPWGSKANDNSAAVVKNNTDLLSINQSVRSQLVPGDVRANYIQTAGIWTTVPSPTQDAPIPKASGYSKSDLRGSLKAFNSTMETYTQGTHCFSCHQQSSTATNSFGKSQLSHIYSEIAPLPTIGK